MHAGSYYYGNACSIQCISVTKFEKRFSEVHARTAGKSSLFSRAPDIGWAIRFMAAEASAYSCVPVATTGVAMGVPCHCAAIKSVTGQNHDVKKSHKNTLMTSPCNEPADAALHAFTTTAAR